MRTHLTSHFLKPLSFLRYGCDGFDGYDPFEGPCGGHPGGGMKYPFDGAGGQATGGRVGGVGGGGRSHTNFGEGHILPGQH